MNGEYKPPYDYALSGDGRQICSVAHVRNRSGDASAEKGRKKRGKKKFLRVFCIVTASVLALLIYFQTNVTRVLISVSESSMRVLAVEAINDAIYRTLGDAPSYDDLIKIERNANGDIVAVSANALKLNKIARDTASLSQQTLQQPGARSVMIPIGALTGIEALAGTGKRIGIKILPVCSVVCGFSSSFESMGINQTRHCVYLNVIADISIVMASRTDKFAVQTDVLAAESVIVGNIPDTYLQTDIFGKKSGL
ncbi:MAG: sporulation protein YunB [Candidatus Borkfalkiaceae bacterium]|nr:sporulation protein YunB [Clostridia bacterium]MDY6223779.1 sporulation protein YunB [Christensenellaceae bacterium]